MSELERIKITTNEVADARVDELVKRDQEARRPAAPANREPPRVPFYYNPMWVYTFAGAIGAITNWAILEPFVSERNRNEGGVNMLASLLLFPLTGAFVGLFIAMSDAALSRNISRALYCGVVGLVIGFIAGIAGSIVGNIVFYFLTQLAFSFIPQSSIQSGHFSIEDINGIAFFLLMVGRALAWTLVATGMGLGQGIALKSKKLVLNGLVGGVIGGFIGGLAFDPIDKMLHGAAESSGAASRFFGLMAVGMAVGFFMGLVENMAKDAWLYMKAGPLAGKQFVIYKDPTTLGSSPKCDIYLFKDAAIEPNHAELRAVGTRYQLKDLGSRQGTFVNGKQVDSHMLQPGDTVVLGETVLEYAERERK